MGSSPLEDHRRGRNRALRKSLAADGPLEGGLGHRVLEQRGERISHRADLGLFLPIERVGNVGIDVDLAEDEVSAADEHHQLRPRERVARKVVLDRTNIADILVAPGGHRRATHAPAAGIRVCRSRGRRYASSTSSGP